MTFYCREHGRVVEGTLEIKRGGKIDWHFYRLGVEIITTTKYDTPTQLSLNI